GGPPALLCGHRIVQHAGPYLPDPRLSHRARVGGRAVRLHRVAVGLAIGLAGLARYARLVRLPGCAAYRRQRGVYRVAGVTKAAAKPWRAPEARVKQSPLPQESG